MADPKYWIRFVSVGQSSLSITDTDDEGLDTLDGWSIDGRIQVVLQGFATFSDTLVSNMGQSEGLHTATLGSGSDQSFMTGDNEPGEYGYVLTELEFFAAEFTRRDAMLVSVWTDSDGSPGENLVQRRLQGGGSTALLRRVVDGLDVFLLPGAQYWIRFENEVGSATLGATGTGDEDSDTAAGWSIGGKPPGRILGPIQVGLSGFAAAAGSSELSGGDLAASQHTTGSVSVGQVFYGSLFVDDRVGVDDERLVSVESFTCDRDWFKLEGLQGGRLYRVEVDFVGVVGGGIQMHQSTWGATPVARWDMWDSNYDGNAVIDFKPIYGSGPINQYLGEFDG